MVDGGSRDWIAFPAQEARHSEHQQQQAKQNEMSSWGIKGAAALSSPEKSHYNSRPPTPKGASSPRLRVNSHNAFDSRAEERDFGRSSRPVEVVAWKSKPLSLAEPDRTYSSASSSSASDFCDDIKEQQDRKPLTHAVTNKPQDRGRIRESTKPQIASQVARSLSRNRAASADITSARGRHAASRAKPPVTEAPTPGKRSTSKSSSDNRGRSESRSRPPITQNKSSNNKNRSSSNGSKRSRSRSRSSSLNRVTGPAPASTTLRSQSPHPASRKPPSTLRTRQEMMQRKADSNRSLGESRGSRQSYTISDDGSCTSKGKGSIQNGKDINKHDSKCKTNKSGIMEKLFGDQVIKVPKSSAISGNYKYEIRPRILLAATVYHNTASNLWIATINTHQRGVARDPAKANRYLKAFSFGTEREARESAIANAPPKMVSFEDSPVCFMCKGKFAVFRRASHCRNCGVTVCPNCTTCWPAKCVPDTYNLKKEAHVKVCLACDSLSGSFKEALLEGDYEEAIALYGTGNVNLRTQFPPSSKKEEIMHPIHCAVEGGSLSVLRWLLDDHYCPYKIVPSNRNGKNRNDAGLPILTAKGRSMMSIAVDCVKVDIMQYLVAKCGISVNECCDLKNVLRALEASLLSLPPPDEASHRKMNDQPDCIQWDGSRFDEVSEPSLLDADELFGVEEARVIIPVDRTKPSSHRARSSRSGGGVCIVCFERRVDSTAAACGHQSCCAKCSSTLALCPVCNCRSDFVKSSRS